MAVIVGKKPAPVAPVKTVPTPMGNAPVKPVPLAIVPPPAAVVDAQEEADAEADAEETTKEPRKTRKDFATHEDFCDYKIAQSEEAVLRAQKKVALWTERKVNKDADVLVKKQKKSDKLFAAFIQVQRDMGMSEDFIKNAVEEFKKKIEAEAAAMSSK